MELKSSQNKNLWTGQLVSGNIMNLNVGSYDYLKLFIRDSQIVTTVDLDLKEKSYKDIVTGYEYGASYSQITYDQLGEYQGIILFNKNTNTLNYYLSGFRYFSSFSIFQNANNQYDTNGKPYYYIYRIEGCYYSK